MLCLGGMYLVRYSEFRHIRATFLLAGSMTFRLHFVLFHLLYKYKVLGSSLDCTTI